MNLVVQMKMNKRGVIEQLQSLIVPLVGIALVLVVGFLIMAKVKEQIISTEGLESDGSSATNLNGTYAFNATQRTMSAMDDIPDWLPVIIITMIGAILLGLVSMFGRRR